MTTAGFVADQLMRDKQQQQTTTVVMALFHCFGASPPNKNDDIEQSLSQGSITFDDNLEKLNGDSIRSENLSVR